MTTHLLNLRDCLPGTTVTICSISPLLSVAQRLRELGLVEGSHVLLLKQEDPVLLLVKDSRIAIDPSTASQITVSHLPDAVSVVAAGSGPSPAVGPQLPVGAAVSENLR